MRCGRLFVFSGLPGVGKSTLARAVVRARGGAYLRIDTIEQGLRDLCGVQVQGEGYRLAYRIAADNLREGVDVIADCCNPVELTRDEWETTAREAGAAFCHIEVICPDAVEHRRRVETRISEVPGLVLPTWEQVRMREYHRWTRQRLVVDTAVRSPEVCARELICDLTRLFPAGG